MGEESGLPEGWVETTLGEVAKWGSGGTPSRSITEYYNGDIPWIKTGDLNDSILEDATEYITELGVEKSSAKIFPKGSVGIAMYGATIGKTGLFGIDAATNQACAVAQPYEILNNKFLHAFLKSQKQGFIDRGKGGAQPNISQTVIKAYPFPLPPLPEQQRIVAKLDALFAHLDALNAQLERIPQLLTNFRQQVLTHAVTGKLTEEWRGGKRLTSWKEAQLKEYINLLTSGSRGWAKYYADSGALFIRAQDIKYDRLEIENAAYVALPESVEGLRTRIHNGDVLVTITGANVTRTALAKLDEKTVAYVNQHVALLRVDKNIYSKFLHLFLICDDYGRKQLLDSAYGQGKPQLNLQNIKDVKILLPSFEEQQEIVQRVESPFCHCRPHRSPIHRPQSQSGCVAASHFKQSL